MEPLRFLIRPAVVRVLLASTGLAAVELERAIELRTCGEQVMLYSFE
jgi:hypothetical protein